MAKKSEPRIKRTSVAPPAASPSHDDIARRAFELFLARGGEHGHAEEDWLVAERELRSAS